jgi:uncharacterized protein YndB with AHSA1/START domain
MAMTDPTYIYVTSILTEPRKVWDALTDARISASYWERSNVSDWKVGFDWKYRLPGEEPDVAGKVLESDPPRRLVITWSAPADAGTAGKTSPEKTSQVTFEIDALDGKVRLRVTHADLDLTPSPTRPAAAGRTLPNPFSAATAALTSPSCRRPRTAGRR